jgi:RND family efflux transporter MFP subunit
MYRFSVEKISHTFKHVWHYAKTHVVTSSLIAVVAVGTLAYATFSSGGEANETTTVQQGPISQYVRVTGQVQASREASLAFQTVGAVAYIGAKIGENVPQGKVLATIGAGDAQATLLQAQSALANAQATLDQLNQGARPEELAIKQQAVDNAKASLDQTYLTIPDVIRNVDATTGDVIKNKLSPLFTFNGSRYTLSFSSCDQKLQSSIEENRSSIETALSDFQKKSSTISVLSSTADIDAVFESAYSLTSTTNAFVASISSLLLSACSISNASLDSYRVTLPTIRTSVTTLFSEISTKRTALTNAKNTYSQAKRDLDLTKAGTDVYVIRAKQALVSQAEAQVASARAGLAKTVIVAPFTGTVSDVDISLGETVSSGKTVIKMLATSAFEVEAKVPEIDVVKIKTGSKVNITLDAYGSGVVFPATVTRVNPSSTLEGNVPMYRVLVTFTGTDERIKSGMTANVNIITEEIPYTLTLPARFVKVIDGDTGRVILRKDGMDTVKEVVLGIRGEDGLIEIKSGVEAGDIIVAPSTLLRSAQKEE